MTDRPAAHPSDCPCPECTEYREFESAFGWSRIVHLTEAEQEDVG